MVFIKTRKLMAGNGFKKGVEMIGIFDCFAG